MNNNKSIQDVSHLVVNMRKEVFDVYIGRNGKGFSACFGNPFPIVPGNPDATRDAVVSNLETLLLEGTDEQAKAMRENLHRLKGKKLGCFCSPQLCHGHVLAHHANSLEKNETLPMHGKKERLTSPWGNDEKKEDVKIETGKTSQTPQSSVTNIFVGYSRYPLPGKESLEMSSHGDKRFSALYARLKDGRSIEEAYQLDVKGYRSLGNDWRLGKGKPPLKDVDLWASYKSLWRQWVKDNLAVFEDLSRLAANKTLTDKFASSPISQARALAELLVEHYGWTLDGSVQQKKSSSELKNDSQKVNLNPKNSMQGDLFEDKASEVAAKPRMRP